MWIRSQDRERLTNVSSVYIDVNENKILGEGYFDYLLGEYSTKEKALKVLDMMEHFRNVVDANKLTFHMPKDDEVE